MRSALRTPAWSTVSAVCIFLLLLLVLALGLSACAREERPPAAATTAADLVALAQVVAPARTPGFEPEPPPASANLSSQPAHAAGAARVEFDAQVRPVLEARCQPCHFAGGTMYERLPFDRPETVRHLGEKLFTRIKDQREQAVLRSFLAQEP